MTTNRNIPVGRRNGVLNPVNVRREDDDDDAELDTSRGGRCRRAIATVSRI
jgi:hypothetical protein